MTLIFVVAVGGFMWAGVASAQECTLGPGPAGDGCGFYCPGSAQMFVEVTGVNVAVLGECNGRRLMASCSGPLGCRGSGAGPTAVSGFCSCRTSVPYAGVGGPPDTLGIVLGASCRCGP
jgi:hypothetical protein